MVQAQLWVASSASPFSEQFDSRLSSWSTRKFVPTAIYFIPTAIYLCSLSITNPYFSHKLFIHFSPVYFYWPWSESLIFIHFQVTTSNLFANHTEPYQLLWSGSPEEYSFPSTKRYPYSPDWGFLPTPLFGSLPFPLSLISSIPPIPSLLSPSPLSLHSLHPPFTSFPLPSTFSLPLSTIPSLHSYYWIPVFPLLQTQMYNDLLAFRNSIAHRAAIPPYMVASNSLLANLSSSRWVYQWNN